MNENEEHITNREKSQEAIMKTAMHLNYQATAISVAQARPSLNREIKIIAFPREFRKDFIKSIDRRMLLSFFICLMLVYGPLAYQASQPKPISSGVISSRILKKLGQVMRVDPRLLEDIETPKIEKTNMSSVSSGVSRISRTSVRSNASDRLNRSNLAKQLAEQRAHQATQRAKDRGLMAVVGVDGEKGKYGSVDLTSSNVKLDNVLDHFESIGFAENSGEKSVITGSRLQSNRAGSIDDLAKLLGGNQMLSVIAGDANNGIIGVGKASISGHTKSSTSAADFQSVFEQQATAVNACYTKELKRSPDIKGKLSVQIRINPSGNVAGLSVTENTVGNDVGQCVQNKIRNWKFPKGHKGMVTIHQTFVFSR